jgi:hypothetical protein
MSFIAIPGLITRTIPWPNGPQESAIVHYVGAAEFRQYQSDLLDRAKHHSEFIVVLKNNKMYVIVSSPDIEDGMIPRQRIADHFKCVRKLRWKNPARPRRNAAA